MLANNRRPVLRMPGRAALLHSKLTLALALAVLGCGDDSSGGGGGAGATGGTGGSDTTRLRVGHLAPELPGPSATRVDFLVVGEGGFLSIDFGQVTRSIPFDPDPYLVQVTEIGSSVDVLASVSALLQSDRRHSVIAYRDSAQTTQMNAMFIEETDQGFTIGHGADDSVWPSLKVVNTDTAEVIVEELPFGGVAPVSLPAGDYSLLFEASPPAPGQQAGPFALEVDQGDGLLLVLVDGDPTVDGAGVEVYALGADTEGFVSPLE